MASTSAFLLLLFAGLFKIIAGDGGFRFTAYEDNRVFSIGHSQSGYNIRDETSEMGGIVVIGSVIGGLVILVLIILFITCCCCPCCCLYQMCRNPRPAVITEAQSLKERETQELQLTSATDEDERRHYISQDLIKQLHKQTDFISVRLLEKL